MQQRLYWLDYDPVAFAVLVIGMGMIGLLTLFIWSPKEQRLECPNTATSYWSAHWIRNTGPLRTFQRLPFPLTT